MCRQTHKQTKNKKRNEAASFPDIGGARVDTQTQQETESVREGVKQSIKGKGTAIATAADTAAATYLILVARASTRKRNNG
jgi:hypothetical protein